MTPDDQLPIGINSGPGVEHWPDDAFAWCQRCDRAILMHEPYMPRIPFVTSHGGFDHQNCRPVLTLIRGGAA